MNQAYLFFVAYYSTMQNIIMLSFDILSAIMPSIIMLRVVMLSVFALSGIMLICSD